MRLAQSCKLGEDSDQNLPCEHLRIFLMRAKRLIMYAGKKTDQTAEYFFFIIIQSHTFAAENCPIGNIVK